MITIAFAILALVALGAATMVVASRNPVVSALWLALTLSAVAGLFVVLDAQFLAVVQLIVYAGAILVFVLFVIMLLNLGELPKAEIRGLQYPLGLFAAAALLIGVGMAVRQAPAWGQKGTDTVAAVAAVGNTEAVATVLYRDYIWAFELTSVLLTAAVVGAVVLARRRGGEEIELAEPTSPAGEGPVPADVAAGSGEVDA